MLKNWDDIPEDFEKRPPCSLENQSAMNTPKTMKTVMRKARIRKAEGQVLRQESPLKVKYFYERMEMLGKSQFFLTGGESLNVDTWNWFLITL